MSRYPKPEEVGIKIPGQFVRERFEAGFTHALQGQQITEREHLRRSFCEGFRSAKLYLRELRRQKGILDFPMKARFKFKNAA